MENKEKIVIVGYGWVGQANALALTQMGYPVFYYDIAPPVHKYEKEYSDLYKKVQALSKPLEEDGKNTWYIVSVGDRVKEDGKQDISLIKNALDGLKPAKGKVILRSTVLPQSLKNLNFDLYIPEFLHEKYAVEECLNPFYFVVGRRNLDFSKPSFLSKWELRARKVFSGTPEQASYVKYLSNIWNAVRIAFINEYGNMIKEPDSRESIAEIDEVIDFIFEKRHYLRYGKSFSGHCLPKDILAFYKSHAPDKNVALLEAAFVSNDLHRKKEIQYQYLPEWFSGWGEEAMLLSNLGFSGLLWYKFNSLQLIKDSRKRLRFLTATLSRLIPDRSMEKVRYIWNQKARENARYYVNTKGVRNKDVTEFNLRESGNYDYGRYVAGDPILESVLNNPGNNRVLEIGSGIGRMTEFFPKQFKSVQGVDLSEVMLESAKKRLVHLPEVELKLCDGRTLDFPDNNFDLAFSYQTLQHVPTKDLLIQNIKEVHRTLKPGGIAKLHLRTGRGPYKWNWSHGVSLTPESAKSMAEGAGFRFLKHQVEDSKGLWVWLEKPGEHSS